MDYSYYLVRGESQYFPIGEVSGKNFYAKYGWSMLNQLINKNQTEIIEFSVRRLDGKTYTIEQFIEEIKQYHLIEDK